MFFQPLFVPLIVSAILAVFCVVQAYRTRKLKRTHWLLRAAACVVLVAVSLRPSYPSHESADTYNSNLDIYFVVDLTSSMVAEDWNGNSPRLDGVKSDISNLLDEYAGAKFTLYTFNSDTFLRVPQTPDATAIATAVNTMNPEVTSLSKGSSISEPVETILEDLQKSAEDNKEDKREKLFLYFGDGEQTIAEEPESFAPLEPYFSAAGVYGYGTEEGGQMKVQSGTYITSNEPAYITDQNGNVGISQMNPKNLETIAEQMNGSMMLSNTDDYPEVVQLNEETLRNIAISEEGANISNTAEMYWLLLIPFTLIMTADLSLTVRTNRALKLQKEKEHK